MHGGEKNSSEGLQKQSLDLENPVCFSSPVQEFPSMHERELPASFVLSA